MQICRLIAFERNVKKARKTVLEQIPAIFILRMFLLTHSFCSSIKFILHLSLSCFRTQLINVTIFIRISDFCKREYVSPVFDPCVLSSPVPSHHFLFYWYSNCRILTGKPSTRHRLFHNYVVRT